MDIFSYSCAFIGASILGFLFYFGAKQSEKIWRKLGEELGLSYITNGELQGKYKGFAVRTRIFRRKGKSNATLIIVKPRVKLPQSLQVCQNTWYEKMNILGEKEVSVGLPVLDEKLNIRGYNSEQIIQLFQRLQEPQILLDICMDKTLNRIQEGEFYIEVSSYPSADEVQVALDRVCRCLSDFEPTKQ